MSRVPTFGGKSVVDPGDINLLRAVKENGLPGEFVNRANRFEFSRGFEPGIGWLLMKRQDIDALDFDAFHELKWTDEVHDTTLSLPSMCIARAVCQVLAVPGSNDDAVYLVQVFDKRRVLMRSSINAQYNVRIPAPPDISPETEKYYNDSLNGGALWTWQTLFTNMWSNLDATTAGTAPTLPYTPTGAPEDYRFIGVSAWQAIDVFLRSIGCEIVYNPVDDEFSVVRLGTTQSGLSDAMGALFTQLADRRLMYDYDPLEDMHLANMPETVRVFFHRNELYYGIEKDTPDADNWEMTPVHTVDYATGIAGGVGVLPVWADLPALFDDTGAVDNSAACTSRANEIGLNIVNKLTVSDERVAKRYAGIVTSIIPGSEIRTVVWRDFSRDGGSGQGGLVTEIFGGPDDKSLEMVGMFGPAAESIMPIDLARKSHPLFPHYAQMIEVTGTKDTTCSPGVYPAKVKRFVDGVWSDLETCWLHAEGDDNNDALESGEIYGPARLSGLRTCSGDTRPVYVMRGPPCRVVIVSFELTATLSLGSSAAAKVLSCPADTRCEVAVDDVITVEDITSSPGMFKGPSGYKGWAYWNGKSGCNYIIINMEFQARVIKATTTSVFSGGVNGTATAAVNDSWQGKAPSTPLTLTDRTGAFSYFPSGLPLLASYDEIDDKYIPFSPTFPRTQELCVTIGNYTNVTSIGASDDISFDKSWAELWQENAAQRHSHIRFRPGSQEGMLWNQFNGATNHEPQMTTCPKVAHKLTIGDPIESSDDHGGVLELVNSVLSVTGAHNLQSGADGGEDHFWILPEQWADARVGWAGRHLAVEHMSGTDSSPCLRWRYTQPGWRWKGTGTALVDANNYSYEFEDGLLVYTDNPDFEQQPTTGASPSCDEDTCVTDDHCP